MDTIFILYVQNQNQSKEFYQKTLGIEPHLHVQGMTEFRLSAQSCLGLMPNDGIHRLLKEQIEHPETGTGIPRCELYLRVGNVSEYFDRAVRIGAKAISLPEYRDWGENVGYCSDPDGHIIAFAGK